jgi:hypothetical protein
MTLREIAEKKLYFRYGSQLRGGMSFWFVDNQAPQPDPENVVVIRDGDCGEVRGTHTISREEFDRRVRDYGLWKQTGLWDFAPADDPAVPTIRYCHRHPAAAGLELYWLRERLRRLGWICRLYDAALLRREEAWIELTSNLDSDQDPDWASPELRAEYEDATLRLARVRKWLPEPPEEV